MKKEIKINGMDCQHCVMAIESALNAIDGVKAKVDLKKGTATVTVSAGVSDQLLMFKINELGYEAVSIAEKKGFW
ncbi:MAG: heavy-metal-associated domain-containing protein [Eubacteriales bacterium]